MADNTIVYDGKTYEMIPFVEIYNDNLTMLNAFSKDTSAKVSLAGSQMNIRSAPLMFNVIFLRFIFSSVLIINQ